MAAFGAMIKLKPHHILPVLGMVVVVAGSNVAVQYPINDWLTWGALTYPFAFLVTDLTNRRYGPEEARRVVYVGFGAGGAAVDPALPAPGSGWPRARRFSAPSSSTSRCSTGCGACPGGRPH